LDANAEEVRDDGDVITVLCDPSDLVAVRKAVQEAGFDYELAEVNFVPSFTEPVADAETAGKIFKVLDALEDLDDVQNVFSNEDVPEEILEQLED
ncbi:MAG: YebC/PmpR family DNA-binding transcriptional regulator, partial [Propionicimonas sp.]